jgi:urease accessory protein
MDGKLPQTMLQGLLSGLGHPVIGPDHLAVIVAVGIAAGLLPVGIGVIGAFIAASTAGVLIHLASVDLPFAETLVALSVIAAGGLVAIGQRANGAVWLAAAVIAGLVHGYVFGESIVGAERAVIGAYLVGIALVAAAIAAGIMGFTKAYLTPLGQSSRHLKIAGLALGCIGVVMLT